MYRWTVDVDGGDWGGRTNGQRGLEEGLPKIIRNFERFGIKSLFFVSTELLITYPKLLHEIRSHGHEVGSHGHFHTKFREVFRREGDKRLSESFFEEKVHYRSPKFGYETEDRYSQKKGHVSILKHMWLGQPIKDDSLIYLHPFDLVRTEEKAPNLFCKIWYSDPNRAYETFTNLLRRYPNSYCSEENIHEIA